MAHAAAGPVLLSKYSAAATQLRKNLAGMNEIDGVHQQLAWPLMIVTRAVPSLAQLLTCTVYLRAASIERDKMQVACYLNL
jgi:hypothetical protein